MAPFTAFQILQGIETLPLRMARHVDNTRRIVAFLRGASAGRRGRLSGAARASRSRARAAAAAARAAARCSASTSKGTRAQGRKFIETLKLFSHLANVGDAKSLVIHPASTTHFRMSADDLVRAGITEGTIRLSIGLEHPDDLIEDLSRALLRGGKGMKPRHARSPCRVTVIAEEVRLAPARCR